MRFKHFYKLDNKALKVDYLFYFSSVLLAAVIFSYLILNFKIYLQNQRIQETENKLLSLDKDEIQIYSKKVLDYKKSIDDFASLINNHKITSNVFSFIEKKTLPNIWFSNFNMQGAANEVKLSGEAENIETLSRQVKVFEESQDYVKSINVLNSQLNSAGKINFLLDIFLDHKILIYKETSLEVQPSDELVNKP